MQENKTDLREGWLQHLRRMLWEAMQHPAEAEYYNPFLKCVISCIRSLGPVLSDLFLEDGVLAVAFKKQVLLNTKEEKH